MKKRVCLLLALVVVMLSSVTAFAEPAVNTVNGYSLPFPAGISVMTRDNHDVKAVGLDTLVTQEYMDNVFASQPGLQIDAINLDPLYEIFVFQNEVPGTESFADVTQSDLESGKTVMAESLVQKGVTLTSEVQIAKHAQTSFYTYTGTADLGGQIAYILAYVTSEDGYVVTVQLQTYDAPANEELSAMFLDLVQNSTFASLTK